jgi:hypothetical protein
MKTVWIYVDTTREVGDAEHLKVDGRGRRALVQGAQSGGRRL